MGIFDRFKKSKKEERVVKESKVVVKKTEVPAKPTKLAKSKREEVRKFDNVHNVLIRPLTTEKISNLGMYNQYAFEVSPKANKIQIKKAVETYYHVKPIKVNVMNMQGKNVRWGRRQGRTKDWKKALVTLQQGDKIEVYEGV